MGNADLNADALLGKQKSRDNAKLKLLISFIHTIPSNFVLKVDSGAHRLIDFMRSFNFVSLLVRSPLPASFPGNTHWWRHEWREIFDAGCTLWASYLQTRQNRKIIWNPSIWNLHRPSMANWGQMQLSGKEDYQFGRGNVCKGRIRILIFVRREQQNSSSNIYESMCSHLFTFYTDFRMDRKRGERQRSAFKNK